MDGDSFTDRRNSLIFKLIYAGGLRISEALNLRVEDVDFEDGAPISFVQRLLGHTSLATTGVYTRLADEMARKIAIETPTAVDGLAEEGLLKEERVMYQVE